MINLSRPYFGDEEKKTVISILNSGNIAQGQYVKKLETKFTSITNTKYAIAVNSGTAALHTALVCVGLKKGDEVITTPFTFVATANSILMAGAKPVFVDIEEKTYNIDPKKIEKFITKRTKAILAVNLYGQPANYKELRILAKKNSLFLIEDAAQSIGATYMGKPSGSLGDIGCFSLYATKNITSGEGGIITTNNKQVAEKAQLFRNHGQIHKKKYLYKGLGYNYRMNEIQAAIALIQLKRLPKITLTRQKIASYYNKSLKKIKGLIVPYTSSNVTHAYHQYTLTIGSQFKMSRDKLHEYLKSKEIETRVYYPFLLPLFDHLNTLPNKDSFPVAEKAVRQVLSIPVRPDLTLPEISYIINTIKNI